MTTDQILERAENHLCDDGYSQQYNNPNEVLTFGEIADLKAKWLSDPAYKGFRRMRLTYNQPKEPPIFALREDILPVLPDNYIQVITERMERGKRCVQETLNQREKATEALKKAAESDDNDRLGDLLDAYRRMRPQTLYGPSVSAYDDEPTCEFGPWTAIPTRLAKTA